MQQKNNDHERYTYRVTWSPEDEEFVALCTEFPSLSYLAENHTKALAGLIDIVKDCVKDMKENGETLPTPLSEKSYSGKFMVRVTPETHRHIAMKAAEQGTSLNRYICSQLE